MMNSATTLDMLSEYHRTLLNHQTYAEDRGYGFVLSIVRPSSLEGRSGKFAKHLAMGAHLARARRAPDAQDEWDSVCHTDLDAWHASWAPLSAYGEAYWAKDRDVLFGDSGQIWINSGLMCARPTARAVAFSSASSTPSSPAPTRGTRPRWRRSARRARPRSGRAG